MPRPHEQCGPAKCINCGGDHPTNDRKCAARKQAELVVKIMTDERLPYGNAKRLAEARLPNAVGTESFAEIAKKQTNQSNSETVSRREYDEVLKKLKIQGEIIEKLKREIGTKNKSQTNDPAGLKNTPTPFSPHPTTLNPNQTTSTQPGSNTGLEKSDKRVTRKSGLTPHNSSRDPNTVLSISTVELSDEDTNMADDTGGHNGLPKTRDTNS